MTLTQISEFLSDQDSTLHSQITDSHVSLESLKIDLQDYEKVSGSGDKKTKAKAEKLVRSAQDFLQ